MNSSQENTIQQMSELSARDDCNTNDIAAGYLPLLAEQYPSVDAAYEELVFLRSMLAMPKETEVCISDIHGEYAAFSHIVRSVSGNVGRIIGETLDYLDEDEKRALVTLVCYPQEKMAYVRTTLGDVNQWYEKVFVQLISVVRAMVVGRTQCDVLNVLDSQIPDYTELFMDLLFDRTAPVGTGVSYQTELIKSTLDAFSFDDSLAPTFIEALCMCIQRFALDSLHVVGDIYDRGPFPEAIMEALIVHPSVDVQWGNHDIVWMGASLGQRGCIAHVVRNCARYGNLSILEDAYGINLRPLASFALDAYRDDPCVAFGLKGSPTLTPEELDLNIKIQKAMAIIQFKVEAQLIDENPSFGLQDRKLLHRIDRRTNTIVVDGVEYALTDTVFPTVDWDNPYQLTDAEEAVMQQLEQAFIGCEKLQRHMDFFLQKGSLYKVSNGLLLFHACVPLNADGSLMETDIYGTKYKGRALYDAIDHYVKAAFYSEDPHERKRGQDLLWYLWLGPGSPLFAKSKMATFELYLIAEKPARKEVKNAFYSLLENEEVLAGIFKDFGLDPATSHIVCGHTPVKVKDGEDPVKCGGKVCIIDGGMSAAYQSTTGIAGFTLIADAYGLVLDSHQPLEAHEDVIAHDNALESQRRVIEQYEPCMTVADSDRGIDIRARMAALESLIRAYQEGLHPRA